MAQLTRSAHTLFGENITLLSNFLTSLHLPKVIVIIVVKTWLYAQEHMPEFIEKGDDYAEEQMCAYINDLWTKSEIPEEVRRPGELMGKLFDFLFGCRHHRYSFPQTERRGRLSMTYVCCLDCGRRFAYDPYNWRRGPELPLKPQAPQPEPSPWWENV